MIDPVIFTIRIGNLQFPLRWYGVIVMIGRHCRFVDR